MRDDGIVQPVGAEIPPGFEAGPSGLVVPTAHSGRARELWRREDGQAIRRAEEVARRYNLLLMVGCNDNRCAENPVIARLPLEGGGFAWRCLHKDRIISTGRK